MVLNLKTVRRHSPYVQLFLTVGTLIALLWGAIYFDLQRTHDQVFSETRNELTNLALAFSKETESAVKTIDVTLQDLRERWRDNRDAFPAAVRRRQSFLEKEIVFQVGVIDRNGLLVFSSLEVPTKPVDLSDRDHFRSHQTRTTDELFISKPLMGRVSKRWSIQFTRAVYDKNDRFDGVVVLSVSPDYFYRFYRSISMPKDSSITLLRGGGEVLSHYPGPELALGKNIRHAPFLEPLAPEAGIITKVSEVDEIERLYAWRKVDRNNLTVVIGHSLDSVTVAYREGRSRAVLAGAGLTSLLLLIAYLKLIAIRQRNKAAQKLAANEERWRLALEAAGDGVWDWDLRKDEVVFSDGWKMMLGYSPEEIGNSLNEWKTRVHLDDLQRVMRDVTSHLDGNTKFYSNEHRVLSKDGQWKWILDRGMVIERDKAGRPVRMVGTHTDVSSRKEMEEMFKNLAMTDALTGLGNRRQFLDRLEGEVARVKRYPDAKASVLMADIDYFKRINDTWGHAVGDAALKHFANVARMTARQSDFIGRIGGEEFAVLLTHTNLQEAEECALRLCAALRQSPLKISDQSISITVSIGVSEIQPGDETFDAGLHRADKALYEAKSTGRDRVVLSEAGVDTDYVV